MKVKRTENFHLDAKAKNSNGFLRATGALSRVGVFNYRKADGSLVRELRLPEEVFKSDAIETFNDTVLTDDHPSVPVDASNAKTYGVGVVHNVRQDGDLLVADVLVTHKDTIVAIEKGKQELSCGYFADVEIASGTWIAPDGSEHKYDAIQRNIQGNHVALVAKGRAGPRARLFLDAEDAVSESLTFADNSAEPVAPAPVQEKPKMKIILDGIEVELSEGVVPQVQARLDASNDRIKALEAEVAALKADASPESFAKKVAARRELERKAAELGLTKFDGSDLEVMAAAVKLDVKEKDAAYIQARFDIAVEEASKVDKVAKSYAAGKIEKNDSESVRAKHFRETYGRV